MNIKIFTFFYGNNYGALLQALSLKEFLINNSNAEVNFAKYQPKDLKNKNILFYLVYYLYKIFSFIVYKFFNKNFLNYRKLAVKTYTKLLKLDNSKGFSLSDKTINSLVNNGSLSADDAIIFVKKMKHQVGNCTNLEIIILDEIE